jgi:hypothetical protein
MPLASVLLFALLLPGTPDHGQPAAASATTPTNQQAEILVPQTVSAADRMAIADDSDICYKIRAYIFERDDDHAPKLVGSTTCGPKAPHTKNAAWPDAKLVPAK